MMDFYVHFLNANSKVAVLRQQTILNIKHRLVVDAVANLLQKNASSPPIAILPMRWSSLPAK